MGSSQSNGNGFNMNNFQKFVDVMTNVWKFTHSEILNRIDHIQYKVDKYKALELQKQGYAPTYIDLQYIYFRKDILQNGNRKNS